MQLTPVMLVVRNGKSSTCNEEDASNKVDEELQDGEVGAKQVGEEDSRHDDGISHSGSLPKEIIIIRSPCLPVTIIAKPADHQDDEDQDLEDHNYYGVYTTICSYNLQHLQNTSWCSQNAGVEGKSHDCDLCDFTG